MTVYEAKEYFEEQIRRYHEEGDQEKVDAYKNALKSINKAINELEEICGVKKT